MSVRVMSLVWDRKDLDSTERLVLLSLADHSDDEGTCYPSMRRLCERTSMGERAIQGAIKRLVERGFLAVSYNAGKAGTNVFAITMPPAANAPPQQMRPRSKCDTPPQQMRHTPAANAPEPSGTIKEPSNSSARATLCEVMRPETADAYIALRKAKRSALTDYAAALIAKKLRGRSDADAVVEESIANGWTGIFPERRATAPPRPSTDLDAAFAAANKILSERPQ